MMKVLKFILVLLISLVSTSFISKEEVKETITKSSYYDGGEVYIQWKPSNSGYWTTYGNYYVYNDFSFMVARSVNRYNGYYHFSVWLYSQSYYWDGYNAQYTSTNMKGINVYCDGKIVAWDHSSLGITFYDKFAPTSLRFKSTNKYPKFYITWKQMSAK